MLYREVWDQKPPLIYWLNVLGVWLGGEGRWGVWALSFGAIVGATALSMRVLTRAFGMMIALVVTTMWLLAYVQLINDGDMTEEFALPLQFACLWLALQAEWNHGGEYRRRGVLIGICVGVIFFLKSNSIGIGIAIALYILLQAFFKRDARDALRNLASIASGTIVVVILVCGVLLGQGTLNDFLDIVVRFNVIYTERFGLLQGARDALRAGFANLALTGLAPFGALGFALGVSAFLWARKKIPPRLAPLLGVCAFALPLEVILVTTTRRGFDHYFVTLFYVLAVWSAFLLWLARYALFQFLAPMTPRVRGQLSFGMFCGIGIFLLPALEHDLRFASELHALEPPPVIEYIRAHTTPEDTVLILGYEPRVLLFAARRAPTRFVHTIPFEFGQYATTGLVENYFDEILEKKPALIVDTRGYGLNNFTPADSATIRRQVKQMRATYKPVGRMNGWMVFAHRHAQR